jgi:hypothetical protein
MCPARRRGPRGSSFSSTPSQSPSRTSPWRHSKRTFTRLAAAVAEYPSWSWRAAATFPSEVGNGIGLATLTHG